MLSWKPRRLGKFAAKTPASSCTGLPRLFSKLGGVERRIEMKVVGFLSGLVLLSVTTAVCGYDIRTIPLAEDLDRHMRPEVDGMRIARPGQRRSGDSRSAGDVQAGRLV
jgi:hypothetical protein